MARNFRRENFLGASLLDGNEKMAKCQTCGCDHGETKCFMIKAFEYYPDGKLKRIEYLTPADMQPQQQVSLANVVPFGTRQ